MNWILTLPSARTLIVAGLVLVGVALAAFGGWAWWDAEQRRTMAVVAEVMTRVYAAQAAEAYAALVKELDPRSFLYEDALIDQARALELGGKKAEAIAVYQRVLKEVPTAKRSDDVRSRLASLGASAR